MESFARPISLRWSDLDPNYHVRHSVYYDWGAAHRVDFLNAEGLTARVMQQLGFGPILFREECVFRKEIRSGDAVSINLQALKARSDFSRWSIRHQITREDGSLCALLTVDGAWIDITRRKLATPPEIVFDVFNRMPRAEEFEWM